MTELGRELYDHLVNELYSVDAPRRRRSVWVMNGEWETELRALADDLGNPLWEAPRPCLFGLPYLVTPDGGIPHLMLMD